MSKDQIRQVEEMLRSAPDLDPLCVDEMREAFEQGGSITPPDRDVISREVAANGVRMVEIDSAETEPDKIILYFHSGGYVMGSYRSHAGIVSHLGKAARARVYFVEYRLAPEHPYPAALEDAVEAYEWLLEKGHAPSSIVVAGDSAGATLAIGALLRARDRSLPMPAAAVLLSPFADLTASGASMLDKAATDLQASADLVRSLAALYLDGADPAAPDVSPVFADLTGLPPLLLHVGTYEALLDDTLRLARRAAIADVAVTVKAWPRLQHQWQLYAAILDEGQQSLAEAGAFISEHLRDRKSVV